MGKIDVIISKLSNPSLQVFNNLYGNDSHIIQQQALRYKDLVNNFKELFGDADAGLFSAPGRTEIGGNHTDHNNGRVLAGAVNLDDIAIAAKNNSNLVSIESEGYPRIEINITDLAPVEQERLTSAAIVRGICRGIKDAGFDMGGFNAVIDGAVPKGSGLSSSAAFEVLVATIINHLFNTGRIDPVKIAKIGQYTENVFFGKPCGLMDQTACSVGGVVAVDFEDQENPGISRVDFDFSASGFALVITDTGGHHADLNEEYAAVHREMKSVAGLLGKEVLRHIKPQVILQAIPAIREIVGDRALLRAMHYHGENQRVIKQVEALQRNDLRTFLDMVIESGQSSFMYNQNIYPASHPREQGVSIGLALSEMVLKGKGAWRVHGGGFAGTIQAFVPNDLLEVYIRTLEHVFGKGSCYNLSIRPVGATRVEI